LKTSSLQNSDVLPTYLGIRKDLTMPTFRVCTSQTHLDAAVGLYIIEAALDSIRRRGVFVLCTSGGSLPKSFASALAWAHASGIDPRTEQWHVFYADERHVGLTDAESNHFCTLGALGGAPWFKATLHPIDPSLDLAACAAAYQRELEGVLAASSGAIDMVLLGMGPDGHTASLFPGHALLGNLQDLVAPIADSPKPPPKRVTLTLRAIRAARQVCFIALGEAKAPLIAAISEATPEGKALPAALVHQSDGGVTFFLDSASARSLAQ
jgi:6-phosphogluconolactonase